MRWLITGATGFLATNLERHLRGRIDTIGISRSGESRCDWTYRGSVRRPGDVARLIKDSRPDVVINTAAITAHAFCEEDAYEALMVNGAGVRSLAEASTDVGAHFVQISTDAVFDGRRGRYTEDDTPNPWSHYGATKLIGEREALAGADALVARVNFFGHSPSGTQSILEFFANAARERRPVNGYTNVIVTSSYVEHLCHALEALVDLRATGLLHVTSADAMSKYAFGLAVSEELGLDPLITATQADKGRDLSLFSNRAERLIGLIPDQREGIKAALA
jgi:dTDP-4-dehydrorhamnose reductase